MNAKKNNVKTVVVIVLFVLTLIGASVAGAGPISGGPDLPNPSTQPTPTPS